MDFKNKKVLVIGCAKSGEAAAKLLFARGADITITDRACIPHKQALQDMGIKVLDGGHPDSLLEESWDFIVKNPGIPYHNPFIKKFVEKHTKILTEVEIAYLCAPKFHYGAITGTNGKTTITSILYELLCENGRALAAGNIGCPLSEQALIFGEEEKDIALELSNFQLLGIDTFRPEVSVVCNLAPDHLDYMDSVEAYYESKMRIYKNQHESDWFLRNVDDPLVMKYAQDIPATVIDFSLTRQDVDLYRKDGGIYLHEQLLFHQKDLKIVGDHNVANAMVAACMAYKLGVSIPAIQKRIKAFQAVEHRLEYIGMRDGVTFYNDSKATNTGAVVTALQSFEKNIILLAGGHDKGIPFDELKVFDDRVKCCIAFGETRHKFQSIFSHVNICETMKEAFDRAVGLAAYGDVVVLSPACSSYDQFKNYEERGRIFKAYVKEYLQQN